MPLRYNKTLRQIFKEILHMQQIGQLDPDTDDKLREYLHTHRKAIRELQRADKHSRGFGMSTEALGYKKYRFFINFTGIFRLLRDNPVIQYFQLEHERYRAV